MFFDAIYLRLRRKTGALLPPLNLFKQCGCKPWFSAHCFVVRLWRHIFIESDLK